MDTQKNPNSDSKVFNLLLVRLYSGQLKPGSKLPPLRAFAKELGSDPGTLRIALKQLEAMNLLDIKRSDGVYIKDFKETGGLDFLTRLFSVKENDHLMDAFFVDEVLRFWSATFPEIMFMAGLRFSSLDLKQFLEIIDAQIRHINDFDRLVELNLKSQDLIGQLANNLLATLFLNSLSPVTRKMTEVFYRGLTPESRLRFLKTKRKGICRMIDGTLDLRVSIENFREEMERCRLEIRKSIAHS